MYPKASGYSHGYPGTVIINYAEDILPAIEGWLGAKPWFNEKNYISFAKNDRLCTPLDIAKRFSHLADTITPEWRIYIIGHGYRGSDGVDAFQKNCEPSNSITLKKIALDLIKLLKKFEFHLNRANKNVTISLLVCYGAAGKEVGDPYSSFAANLQSYLRMNNIWVNILARVYPLLIAKNGKFTISDANRSKFEDASATQQDKKRLLDKQAEGAKYYFFWTKQRQRRYVDAYVYKELVKERPDLDPTEILGVPLPD